MKPLLLLLLICILPSCLHAAESTGSGKHADAVASNHVKIKKAYSSIDDENFNPRYQENNVEASWETGVMFGLGNPNHYIVSPNIFSIRWQLDNVGNPGWRRGNTEWTTSFFVEPILEGPESRAVGFMVGPRYYFVQPNSKWVPYIESRVGLLWIDSNGIDRGQGQDFCFTFLVGCGVRYDFNDHWTASLGLLYQHISNGGLSEPARRNTGLDLLGPTASVVYKF